MSTLPVVWVRSLCLCSLLKMGSSDLSSGPPPRKKAAEGRREGRGRTGWGSLKQARLCRSSGIKRVSTWHTSAPPRSNTHILNPNSCAPVWLKIISLNYERSPSFSCTRIRRWSYTRSHKVTGLKTVTEIASMRDNEGRTPVSWERHPLSTLMQSGPPIKTNGTLNVVIIHLLHS